AHSDNPSGYIPFQARKIPSTFAGTQDFMFRGSNILSSAAENMPEAHSHFPRLRKTCRKLIHISPDWGTPYIRCNLNINGDADSRKVEARLKLFLYVEVF
ncbi:MAG: hypothetical protein LBM08_08360, partial [Dysgonamonadaceae bacterium]|nr:hypothetical protein [Dysgonamonadaceae bacterium]